MPHEATGRKFHPRVRPFGIAPEKNFLICSRWLSTRQRGWSHRLPAPVDAAGVPHKTFKPAARQHRSQKHALFHNPEARAVQEHFINIAARDLKLLRAVLHQSSNAQHRALAAEIMAYTTNKKAVVKDLVYGMSDPDAGVRNNAMRARRSSFSDASAIFRMKRFKRLGTAIGNFLFARYWTGCSRDSDGRQSRLRAVSSRIHSHLFRLNELSGNTAGLERPGVSSLPGGLFALVLSHR